MSVYAHIRFFFPQSYFVNLDEMSQDFLKSSIFLVDLLCNVPKTIWRLGKKKKKNDILGWILTQASFFLRKKFPGSDSQASLCRSLALPSPVCPSWTLKPPCLIVPAGNHLLTGSLLPLAAWPFFGLGVISNDRCLIVARVLQFYPPLSSQPWGGY